MGKGLTRVAVLVLVTLLVLLLAACSAEKSPYPFISLSKVEPEHNNWQPLVKQGEPLRVALASITSARESFVYYDELLKYLSNQLGRPVEIIQRKTYAEVNNLVRDGQVDLAFVCTYSYVLGHDDFGMELLVAPRVQGQSSYRSCIITRKDSGIDRFEQLRGKTFAFTDPLSTSGTLYPIYLLKQAGETPDSFFKKYIFTYSHDNSIKAVADGLVDGAAVDSLVLDYMTERNPAQTKDLQVIHESPIFAIPPVVVRPGLEPELKEKLRATFLAMDQDPQGRRILAQLRVDKYVVIEDAAYNTVRALGDVKITDETRK
ncbi:hypothetical protein SY88_17910 [Clostridiales bacterium PH28_bin88]|nr:hypothetical protein SY88_17910 [Clostridiales bacterium PH28_bin88]